MTARDPSPSSTVGEAAVPTEPTAMPPTDTRTPLPKDGSEGEAASTIISEETRQRAEGTSEKGDRPANGKDGAFDERGIIEIEQDGQKRKALLVIEEKSGKELLKDVEGGPYTIPRWYELRSPLSRLALC